MGASEDMLGIMPPIIVAGAVTKMASSMFGSGKEKTRTVYKTKYVKKAKKVEAKRKKVHAKRVKAIKKEVKKYL
jgi:hypothetical protein